MKSRRFSRLYLKITIQLFYAVRWAWEEEAIGLARARRYGSYQLPPPPPPPPPPEEPPEKPEEKPLDECDVTDDANEALATLPKL